MSFMPGLELSRRFFEEAVAPLLLHELPDLSYSAGKLGGGSDVLGFDTEMSMDHDWGPSVTLFLPSLDLAASVDTALGGLPDEFMGFPVGFAPNSDGTTHLAAGGKHRVELTTVERFFADYLGFDISGQIEPADWLTFPEQKLRTLRSGEIFRDDLRLASTRERFDYYPHDVWLYQLASVWTRIGQEEHLMGRAGHAGAELGSSLIASRLVRDIMRLCFLMERQYAPYSKWFGTAFEQLCVGPFLIEHLEAAQRATTWQKRQACLVPAYEELAQKHNRLEITDPLPDRAIDFHGRPFKVIHLAGGFADAIAARIEDPGIKGLASKRLIGGIDVFSDSTDLVTYPEWRAVLKGLYELKL